MPTERYSAIKRTEQFLIEIQNNPAKYSPEELKVQAHRCLKHYPSVHYLDEISVLAPDILKKEQK
jgi:hypothetical protein